MSGLKNIIQNIKLDINSTVKKQHGGKKRSHTLKKTKTKRNKKTKKITKKYKGKKRRKRNV
jgi:citrate lyase gamma subunit